MAGLAANATWLTGLSILLDAARVYIRRRNRDRHALRIIELENGRKVAWESPSR